MPLSAYLKSGLAYQRREPRPMISAYESKAPEDIRYFDELGYWMGRMLPASTDATDELVASFQQIGLSVGKGFEWQTLDEPTKRGLARAAKARMQIIDSKWAAVGEKTNGWKYAMAEDARASTSRRAPRFVSMPWEPSSPSGPLPENERGRPRRGTERRAEIRPALRGWETTAGIALLERRHVCRRHAFRRKRLWALQLREHDRRAQEGRRRLADDPDPERTPRGHLQLAPGTQEKIHLDHALLRPTNAGPRRLLSVASSKTCRVIEGPLIQIMKRKLLTSALAAAVQDHQRPSANLLWPTTNLEESLGLA
jgi:hypothetical protein